eukprot:2128041-Alexandrium_andersonii.AAC.1
MAVDGDWRLPIVAEHEPPCRERHQRSAMAERKTVRPALPAGGVREHAHAPPQANPTRKTKLSLIHI